MTSIVFSKENGRITGFEISDHSGYADHGADILCASISSAAYMAANTITDVIGVNAYVTEEEDPPRILMILPKGMEAEKQESCQIVLNGLKLHLKQMSKQYRKYLKVSEV